MEKKKVPIKQPLKPPPKENLPTIAKASFNPNFHAEATYREVSSSLDNTLRCSALYYVPQEARTIC